MSGGSLLSGVSGNFGNDTIGVSGTAQIGGDIDGGEGNDTISVSGGSILGSVYGDTFDFEFEGADDTISASGGTIAGSIFARDGADNVSVSGTAQIGVADGAAGSVLLEDGDDIFSMSGGTLAGAVIGGTGNDRSRCPAAVSWALCSAMAMVEPRHRHDQRFGGQLTARSTRRRRRPDYRERRHCRRLGPRRRRRRQGHRQRRHDQGRHRRRVSATQWRHHSRRHHRPVGKHADHPGGEPFAAGRRSVPGHERGRNRHRHEYPQRLRQFRRLLQRHARRRVDASARAGGSADRQPAGARRVDA